MAGEILGKEERGYGVQHHVIREYKKYKAAVRLSNRDFTFTVGTDYGFLCDKFSVRFGRQTGSSLLGQTKRTLDRTVLDIRRIIKNKTTGAATFTPKGVSLVRDEVVRLSEILVTVIREWENGERKLKGTGKEEVKDGENEKESGEK